MLKWITAKTVVNFLNWDIHLKRMGWLEVLPCVYSTLQTKRGYANANVHI